MAFSIHKGEVNSFHHDLETIIYVRPWICTFYNSEPCPCYAIQPADNTFICIKIVACISKRFQADICSDPLANPPVRKLDLPVRDILSHS